MLEKMARALCLEAGLDPDRKFKSSDYSAATDPQEFAWQEYLPAARAALLAIREANSHVADAGYQAIRDSQWWEQGEDGGAEVTPYESGAQAFTAMIDAILNEGTAA